MITNWSGSL